MEVGLRPWEILLQDNQDALSWLGEVSPYGGMHHEVLEMVPQGREGSDHSSAIIIPGLSDLGVSVADLIDEREYPYGIWDYV